MHIAGLLFLLVISKTFAQPLPDAARAKINLVFDALKIENKKNALNTQDILENIPNLMKQLEEANLPGHDASGNHQQEALLPNETVNKLKLSLKNIENKSILTNELGGYELELLKHFRSWVPRFDEPYLKEIEGPTECKTKGTNQIEQISQDVARVVDHADCALDKQIERLRALKRSGKKINLIVGRRNIERNQPPLKYEPNEEFVYCDIQKTDHCSEFDPIQLTMDCGDINQLSKIDNEIFNRIIFDFSVAKFFKDKRLLLEVYFHKLIRGGKFFSDFYGNGLINYDRYFDIGIEYDSKIKPGHYEIDTWNFNVILPIAYSGLGASAAEVERIRHSGRELLKKAEFDLAGVVENRAKEVGFTSFKLHNDQDYPVKHWTNSTNVRSYYEITK